MDVRQRKRQDKKPEKSLPKNEPVNSTGYLSLFFKVVVLLLPVLPVYFYMNSPIIAKNKNVEITPLSGKFKVNDKLAKGIKARIELDGPECFAEDERGDLYTGLNDGRVVKISKSTLNGGNTQIETIIDGVFPDQERTTDAMTHGRPLGLRLRVRTLFVMDAIYGFYSMDLDSGKITFLVTPSQADPPMEMPDDLDISRDGSVAYFSDISAKYPLDRMHYGIMEGECSGRLLRYTFASKKLEVLVTGLCSANGVQLSVDEKTIFVVESMLYQVKIFDTKTWKLLKTTKLPILPDNIRRTNRGTYWVAGGFVPSPTMAHLFWRIAPLRQMLAGMINHEKWLMFLIMSHDTTHNIAIELDGNGEVLRALHDPKGSIIPAASSHVHELADGRLVVGSYFGPNLAIIAKPTK